MAKPAVTVISNLPYRGGNEEFSNQFHFTGSAPTTPAGWDALCAAFVTKFKALIYGNITIKRIYCYTDSDVDSVYTYNLSDHGGVVTGTLVPSSGYQVGPGDTAYWLRWTTGRLSSKGKAIYLRKYLHPAIFASGVPDATDATARTALATAGAAIAASSGAWPGMAGPTYDLSSPVCSVSPNNTTRTLKRRGKRP